MFKNGQKPYLSVFVCFLLFAFALAQILPSSVDGSAGPASAFAKERKEQSYKHTGSSSRRHAASSERSRSRGSRDSRDEGGSGGQSGRESIGAALGAAAAATGVSLGTAAGSSGDDADAPLPGYQPPSDTSPVTLNPAVDVDGEEGAVTGEGQDGGDNAPSPDGSSTYRELGGDDDDDGDPTAYSSDTGASSSLAPEARRIVRKGTLRNGEDEDTIFKGADPSSRREFRSAARKYNRSWLPGHFYSIVCDGTGCIKRLEYEIDPRKRLVVEGDEPVARLENVSYRIALTGVVCIVRDDIFQAVADMGESPRLAAMLAEVFGTEINFLKDVHPGDSFAIAVEKRYQNGNYYGYGRIVAASFTSSGHTFETFLFPTNEKDAYYNAKGENTHRAFLQAPLAVTRITSRFSMSRKHPILGYSRPHQGVDYAAPTGTPIKAVSDGVVTARGWGGQSGNRVIIAHADGLESLYSHLSGFARGLRNGSQVSQGQVIGFVGMTGLATGPHLDFRLRKNGQFIDPSKALNPRSAPVGVSDKKKFRDVMAVEKEFLTGHKPLTEYDPAKLFGE